ncbi:hypothetical protein SAMN05421823_102212 [Catalinimonas alkaloidigena]|uniref:SMP-30/Gluconolaconase/LRE-like region-containing protein n=1 Tax=Catalinimonas alkaloidigena TaxID=1075417 RepID=A0A1G9AB12_9BACT|nr:hypothetical protein [Catalinimonas alkaloidigena]SDK23640.1 hypothetical protein SAMN05421823_102212 [Catalinimonas alkaloidigena]
MRTLTLSSFFITGCLLWSCGEQPSSTDEAAMAEDSTTVATPDAPVRLVEVWKLTEGLKRPESVVYDETTDMLYVSSINGDSSVANGVGYLSKVSPDGELVNQMWITGLKGPKGLALRDGKLYVADVDELVVVDVAGNKVEQRYPAAGGIFLNDVTLDDDGNVYVSDSRAGHVYRLHEGTFDSWVDIPEPNGVHVVDGALLIAAADSTKANPGSERYLQVISLDDASIKPLRDLEPVGGLDALEPDGPDGYFLTDWGAGKVMYYTQDRGPIELMTLTQGTADLELAPDRDMVYLPVMVAGQLIAYRVERN